ILTEPVTPDGDLGVLFLHNEGWSTMCGHGIIALTTALLETGQRAGDVVRYDAPPGRVTARATRDGARVREVAFDNVPSFALSLDEAAEVEGLGEVRHDRAFGGSVPGVSARVGIERARGRLPDATSFTVESIIGTRFRGRAISTLKVGPYDAVVPEVAGSAWTVGRSELWVAPDDPLREGFVLR